MENVKNSPVYTADDVVINRILDGDTNLYEVLMRRYNQRLYRIGRSFFKDDDEIEDIMQFTYIRAFEKLSSFERRSQFSTWLIRIFINEAIARKKYRGKFIHHPENDDDITNEYFFNKVEMNTPDNNAVNNELKELLEKAIDSLPEKYRVVFIMHELEKLSVKETGESLGLTDSNVKVRVNRAKKMLRDYLVSFYPPEEIYSFNLIRCDFIVDKVLQYINRKTTV